MNKNALLLFIKAPILGKVKTRLQPQLTQKQSLRLYKAFVEDLMCRLKYSTLFDLHIFFYPENSLSMINNWLEGDYHFHSQIGKNLGQKMSNAFEWAFDNNYEKAILIGSDIPTLTTLKIEKAYGKLDQHDLVIGPSEDGGYYLIGMKKYLPQLFRNIPWSTNIVLDNTLKRANVDNLLSFQLPHENDIDFFEDALHLWEKINSDESYHQTKTYEALKKILSDAREIIT